MTCYLESNSGRLWLYAGNHVDSEAEIRNGAYVFPRSGRRFTLQSRCKSWRGFLNGFEIAHLSVKHENTKKKEKLRRTRVMAIGMVLPPKLKSRHWLCCDPLLYHLKTQVIYAGYRFLQSKVGLRKYPPAPFVRDFMTSVENMPDLTFWEYCYEHTFVRETVPGGTRGTQNHTGGIIILL